MWRTIGIEFLVFINILVYTVEGIIIIDINDFSWFI